MKRTEWQEETRLMRFEETYVGWQKGRLTQEEAAQILGVSDRSFRRYIHRYNESGLEGLVDYRLREVSHKKAPVDEVLQLAGLYKETYRGWNVRHFWGRYREYHGGQRSYTWVKNRLQDEGLVKKGKRKGVHRKRRERTPLPGMMIHQDGSTHEWVKGMHWDLIVTMDDATNEIYSGFFVDEEGTVSSFQGVSETLESHGIFSSFYSDRGSHYWHTPEAGGPVDKKHPTQFGRAMQQLGIQMIAAYSPQARGRSERMFKTLQGRIPRELVLHGITDMETANRYLKNQFLPAFNKGFKVTPREDGSAFVPLMGCHLREILCPQEERVVGNDNCVRYQGKILQLPPDQSRYHYVKTTVRVHAYPDGGYAVFHGPRKLACYDASGTQIQQMTKKTDKTAA